MQLLFKLAFAVCFCLVFSTVAIGAENIVVPGTGDSQKLLRALADDFQERHPGVQIDIPESVGSIGGIKRVLNNENDIARVARTLTEQEKSMGLKNRVFAYSPVVFAANLPTPCVKNLTRSQIVDIYGGRITSWHQLDDSCPEHKVYVANREEGDSSRTIITAQIPQFGRIEDYAGKVIYSTPETLEILKRYPHTIGYIPLSMVLNSDLVFFNFEGVAPTIENIGSEDYELAVPLGIVWTGELDGLPEAFVDYLVSPPARQIILDNGAVPARR